MGIVQRDSFRISIITYAGTVIGFLNKIFLFTNYLSADQVGLANLIISLSLIYAQVSALGSRSIITRFFPFFNDPQKNHHGFLFGMLALSAFGFTIAAFLFILLKQPFVLLYKDSSPLLVEYALYLLPLGMANIVFNFFEAYLRSLQKNIMPSLAYELILRLTVTFSVSLFALGLVSFPAFVAIYVAAYCLPAILLIFYAAFKGLLKVKPVWSKLLRRMGKLMLVYGLFSLLNNIGGTVLVNIDALMVAGMIDLGAAGIYTTMIFLTSIMLIPYRSLIKVAAPLVAGFWKNRDTGKIQEIYVKATSGNLVVGATLFMLLWVNLDSVFYFIPPEYETGRYVFLLLGIGKLFDMSAGLNSVILNTSKKYRYDLLFILALLVFAFVTNLIFIPLWGIEGAAFASMLSLILFNLMRIAFLQYQFHIQPFTQKQIWVPVTLTAICVISEYVEPLSTVLTDIIVRSATSMAFLLVPLWYLKVSPELNQWTLQQIKKASVFFGK